MKPSAAQLALYSVIRELNSTGRFHYSDVMEAFQARFGEPVNRKTVSGAMRNLRLLGCEVDLNNDGYRVLIDSITKTEIVRIAPPAPKPEKPKKQAVKPIPLDCLSDAEINRLELLARMFGQWEDRAIVQKLKEAVNDVPREDNSD